MPPRARSRSRSRSANPDGEKAKTPRSRRSSVKGGSTTATPAKPKRKVELPDLDNANELLLGGGVKAGPLKLQDLTLDGNVHIAICRVKLPTPKGVSGHLIRRLDTDAVSASSLFRVAFPTASVEAEQAEMDYLEESYDTVAAGHADETHRLTGTWIPTADAPALAADYNLSQFVGELLSFKPGETPLKVGTTVSVPSSAQTENSTPVRSSKRQRLKSNEPVQPSVTVSQTIASDPITGEIAETTQVTVEGQGLIGSDATVEKAMADAKQLVETLKKEGTLPSVEGEVNTKKRSAEEIEDALVTYSPANTLFGRILHPTPNARRLIAVGGVLVTGAAAAAAPYFFG